MGLARESFDPGLWHLAQAGDEIAGVALNAWEPDSNTGWIDHLGVRRTWRRQGIGMALMLHSFAVFYHRGVRHIRLSVDSTSMTHAPRLYERAGMQVTDQYHIYRKVIQSENG
jgi:ribosomal protein S18 acetylase RimI-like enzyme